VVTEPVEPSTEQSDAKLPGDEQPTAAEGAESVVDFPPAQDDEEATDELPTPPDSEIEARLRQVSAAYVKLQGEMQAFRERNERIQEERDRRRRGEVVTAMFEPVQNLRRSLDSWRALDLPDEATQGLALVLEQFQVALRKLGLEEIVAAPAPFDPNIHDAICTMPVQHASLDGQVIQVFEAGYRVGTTVIQAARVIIGRYEAPVSEEQEAEPDSEAGAEE
jgi:molecular chaperone GrpE